MFSSKEKFTYEIAFIKFIFEINFVKCRVSLAQTYFVLIKQEFDMSACLFSIDLLCFVVCQNQVQLNRYLSATKHSLKLKCQCYLDCLKLIQLNLNFNLSLKGLVFYFHFFLFTFRACLDRLCLYIDTRALKHHTLSPTLHWSRILYKSLP